MNNKVINIEDHVPHMCLMCVDGNVRVFPTHMVLNIISGELNLTDVDDWKITTKTIFQEWIKTL